MVGGALEYLALLTGFRSLLLVVAILYLLAFVLAKRWRFLSDRELIVVSPGAATGSQRRGRSVVGRCLEGTDSAS